MCPSLIEIGLKTAEKKSDKQTDRQTDTTKNNGHLAVNQHHQCQHWCCSGTRSSVHAGGGHFERMLWHECSVVWFNRIFYEIVNV